MVKIGYNSVRVLGLNEFTQIAIPPKFFNIFPLNFKGRCKLGIICYEAECDKGIKTLGDQIPEKNRRSSNWRNYCIFQFIVIIA